RLERGAASLPALALGDLVAVVLEHFPRHRNVARVEIAHGVLRIAYDAYLAVVVLPGREHRVDPADLDALAHADRHVAVGRLQALLHQRPHLHLDHRLFLRDLGAVGHALRTHDAQHVLRELDRARHALLRGR